MNESMDRVVADWLREGPEMGPREGLERALAATRRVSQRPGWTIPERWLPMQLTMQRVPAMGPVALLALVALLVVAFAAAALFVGSQRRLPEPFGLAGNGAIVFERDGDLVVADALGAGPRTLIGGSDRQFSPVFSPRGDRLAFLQGDAGTGIRLLSARPDGSEPRQLAGPFDQVDTMGWSTDGSMLLVGHSGDGPPGITIIPTDGSRAADIPVDMAADLASWRPGGSQIVFRGQPRGGTKGIYLVNADGSDLTPLELPTSPNPEFEYEGLAWSPDGSRLSWMDDEGTAGWRTSVADVDATGRVTSVRELALAPGSTSEMLPNWSPDGSRLAFVLERDGTRQVAVARADRSGSVTPIGPSIEAGTGGFGHGWSPDGRTVLITVVPTNGPQTFWSVDVASGVQTQVDGLSAELPAWQRIAP